MSTPRVIGVFLLLATLNWLASALIVNAFFSLTSAALFAYLIYVVFKIDQRLGALLLSSIVTHATVVISLIAIEFGAYMPEVARTGEPGDASASFVFFCFWLFVPAACVFRAFARTGATGVTLPKATALSSFGVILFVGGLIAYLILFGLQTGFPLLSGTDRYVYRHTSADVIVSNVLVLKFALGGLLGWVTFCGERKILRLASLVLMAALTGTFFLFSEKFGTHLANLSFFVAPKIIQSSKEEMRAFLVKSTPVAAALLGAMSCLTYYIYSKQFALGYDETFRNIFGRFASQGELWYLANLYNPAILDWDSDFVSKQIDAMSEPDMDVQNFRLGLGTFYFIFKYAPSNLINNVIANKGITTYTMGHEALLLALFGYIGAAIGLILTGLVGAIVAGYMWYGFRIGSAFSVLFAALIMSNYLYMVNQGTPTLLFSVGRIKFYAFFICFEVAQSFWNRHLVDRNLTARRRIRASES